LAEFTIFASEAVLAFLLPPGQPLPPAGWNRSGGQIPQMARSNTHH
jgi:hypothetical protein